MGDRDELFQPLARVRTTGLTPREGPSAEVLRTLEHVPDADLGPDVPPPRRFSPRLLLGYKWSILAVFLVLATGATIGIWLFNVPLYKATAIIEVSPVIPQLLAGKSDMVPLYESYRGSQADYLRNPVVLNGVLDDSRIQATRWYRATPTSPLEALLDRLRVRQIDPPLDRLTEALQAEVPKGKQLIYVSMLAAKPQEAKLIVDKVLAEYVKFTNGRTSASDNDVMAKLRKEIGDREVELKTLENVASHLRQQLGTGAPEELVRQRALDLQKLESSVSSLKTDIEVARRTLAYVRRSGAEAADAPAGASASQPGAELAANPATASVANTQPTPDARYMADSRWQSLSDRLAAARRELERRHERFGDADPRLAELQKDRDEAEAQLRAWEGQLDRAVVVPGQAGGGTGVLRESIEQMTIRLELLTKMLEEEKAAAQQVFSAAERLAQQTAERSKTEATRQQLERRLEELRMNREVAGSVQTYPALEPSTPDNDKRWKLTAAAVCAALVASIGLAIARIKLSPTVDQVGEVTRPTHGAFLGHLPLCLPGTYATLAPDPIRTEAVRLIRTALLNRLNGAGCALVQITSATIGSGKSTLATLLARSLAQGGKQVLLVDTDLHRPTVAERFALDPVPGLRELLARPDVGQIAIRVTTTPGLSVLPGGARLRSDDGELLANGKFSALLEQWRQRYDLVLLDSAPLLGPADAAILSGHVDGTIIVVRERHCRREAVVDALATLSAAGGRLLGTVFVGSNRPGGYGYGYGYGYDDRHGAGSGRAAAATGDKASAAPGSDCVREP